MSRASAGRASCRLLDQATGLAVICLPRALATAALAQPETAADVAALGRAAGTPWRKEHNLSAVAALTAARRTP